MQGSPAEPQGGAQVQQPTVAMEPRDVTMEHATATTSQPHSAGSAGHPASATQRKPRPKRKPRLPPAATEHPAGDTDDEEEVDGASEGGSDWGTSGVCVKC